MGLLESTAQRSASPCCRIRQGCRRPLISVFSVSAFAQDIPAQLAPPQGATLLGGYAAKGVQIYVCRANRATNEWDLKALEAELTDAQGKPFAKHYGGPTWEAEDGSKVEGKALVTEPAPNQARYPGCYCRRTLRHRGYLPACVLSNVSTLPAEPGRSARVRRSGESSVPITRLTTCSISEHRCSPSGKIANGAQRAFVKVHWARQRSMRSSTSSQSKGFLK
jgi:hypothetical protein